MKVYLVYPWPDTIDSVWDTEDAAIKRVNELNDENHGDYAGYMTYELNKPDGVV